MLNQNRVDLGIAERVMLSEMGYNGVVGFWLVSAAAYIVTM
jgi:hypothetical protein